MTYEEYANLWLDESNIPCPYSEDTCVLRNSYVEDETGISRTHDNIQGDITELATAFYNFTAPSYVWYARAVVRNGDYLYYCIDDSLDDNNLTSTLYEFNLNTRDISSQTVVEATDSSGFSALAYVEDRKVLVYPPVSKPDGYVYMADFDTSTVTLYGDYGDSDYGYKANSIKTFLDSNGDVWAVMYGFYPDWDGATLKAMWKNCTQDTSWESDSIYVDYSVNFWDGTFCGTHHFVLPYYYNDGSGYSRWRSIIVDLTSSSFDFSDDISARYNNKNITIHRVDRNMNNGKAYVVGSNSSGPYEELWTEIDASDNSMTVIKQTSGGNYPYQVSNKDYAYEWDLTSLNLVRTEDLTTVGTLINDGNFYYGHSRLFDDDISYWQLDLTEKMVYHRNLTGSILHNYDLTVPSSYPIGSANPKLWNAGNDIMLYTIDTQQPSSYNHWGGLYLIE